MTAPVYSEIISMRMNFKTDNYSLCMFVDVWTLHRSDEIDAQIEAHEGSFWGQNSHPVVGIFGANSMVGYACNSVAGGTTLSRITITFISSHW